MNAPNRILTTLVGSLPRPELVVQQLFAQDSGLNYNEAAFADPIGLAQCLIW